jgi:hypothetical protein
MGAIPKAVAPKPAKPTITNEVKARGCLETHPSAAAQMWTGRRFNIPNDFMLSGAVRLSFRAGKKQPAARCPFGSQLASLLFGKMELRRDL